MSLGRIISVQNWASMWRNAPISPASMIALAPKRQRMVAIVKGLEEHETGLVGDLRHLCRLVRIGRHGLFAEHMLAGLQYPDRPLGVQTVGQRIVDGVDLGIGQQRFVRVVDMRDAVLACKCGSPVTISRGDGDDLDVGLRARRADERLRRDASRAEDADADDRVRFVHFSFEARQPAPPVEYLSLLPVC